MTWVLRDRTIGAGYAQLRLDLVDLHHLVAVVVDDLDRYLSGLRSWKGPTRRRVELRPRCLVDVCTQGAAELRVGVVATGEVGVADEEALAVVGGVDEP